MATTLKSIAHMAGVTPNTVSQALRGKGRIGEAKRKAIIRLAAEMNYRPNATARAMRCGRFGAVAMLNSEHPYLSHLPNELLWAVHDALAGHGMHMLLAKVPDENLARRGYLPRLLKELSVDGLLINYTSLIPEPMIAVIDSGKIPHSWINNLRPTDSVLPDETSGSEMAVAHLVGLGHRRIAYLPHFSVISHPAPAHWHFSGNARHAGYVKGMQAAGLAPIMPGEGVEDKWVDKIGFCTSWMSKAHRPTAVLCYNEDALMPVLAAAFQLGMVLPRDMSIVNFSDRQDRIFDMEMTCVAIPEVAMGQAAVDMLIKKILDPEAILPNRLILPEFMPGTSTAPPPG